MGTGRGRGGRGGMETTNKRKTRQPLQRTSSFQQRNNSQQLAPKRGRGGGRYAGGGSAVMGRKSYTPSAAKPRTIADAFVGQGNLLGGRHSSEEGEEDEGMATEPAEGSDGFEDDREDIQGSGSEPLRPPSALMQRSSDTALHRTPSTGDARMSAPAPRSSLASGLSAAERIKQREQHERDLEMMQLDNETLKLKLEVRSQFSISMGSPFTIHTINERTMQ